MVSGAHATAVEIVGSSLSAPREARKGQPVNVKQRCAVALMNVEVGNKPVQGWRRIMMQRSVYSQRRGAVDRLLQTQASTQLEHTVAGKCDPAQRDTNLQAGVEKCGMDTIVSATQIRRKGVNGDGSIVDLAELTQAAESRTVRQSARFHLGIVKVRRSRRSPFRGGAMPPNFARVIGKVIENQAASVAGP